MRCRPAISSHSLGRAWVHSLPSKLDQAARYGFDIELFYEDLYYLAKEFRPEPTREDQIVAAQAIHSMCSERGISIVCLQPFMHYEGLRDRVAHRRRIQEFSFWLKLAETLHTDIISLPSTFLSRIEASGDLDLIVDDLQEVADLAALQNIRLAYESLAWGTYTSTWEQSWEIVERVNRSNFGICLDTFNIAARVYADPASPTRKTLNAETDMQASICRMTQKLDVSKIMYIQVVDAEFLDQPLVEGHEYYNPKQPARMTWSRNCRLFYGEEARGAYLPVEAILKAILVDLGFEGWISAELFNKSLVDPDPLVPEQHAQRAAVSWAKIQTNFGLVPAQVRAGSTSPVRAQL